MGIREHRERTKQRRNGRGKIQKKKNHYPPPLSKKSFRRTGARPSVTHLGLAIKDIFNNDDLPRQEKANQLIAAFSIAKKDAMSAINVSSVLDHFATLTTEDPSVSIDKDAVKKIVTEWFRLTKFECKTKFLVKVLRATVKLKIRDFDENFRTQIEGIGSRDREAMERAAQT